MFFYHHNIWGFSGEGTERVERFNERKKAKPRITNLVHPRDKEEYLQAKKEWRCLQISSGEGAHVQVCPVHP